MKRIKNKNKKTSIPLIFILVLVFIGCIIWYKLYTRDVYILDIPNSYNLSSIVYETDNGITTLYEEDGS